MNIIYFFLFFSMTIYSQQDVIFDIPENEILITHSEYKNTLLVTTMVNHKYYHTRSFDENGNILWEKEFHYYDCENVFQISDDRLLFFRDGSQDDRGYNDSVFCVARNSGQLFWKFSIGKGNSSISPEHNYILTKNNCYGGSKFEIFDIRKMEKVASVTDKLFFRAEWINDRQFVFVEPVPKGKYSINDSYEYISGARIKIYDLDSGRFIISKKVADLNGKSLKVGKTYSDGDFLLTDKKFIYLVASGTHEKERTLLKYDFKLNLISTKEISGGFDPWQKFFFVENKPFLKISIRENSATQNILVNLETNEIFNENSRFCKELEKKYGDNFYYRKFIHDSDKYYLQENCSQIVFRRQK